MGDGNDGQGFAVEGINDGIGESAEQVATDVAVNDGPAERMGGDVAEDPSQFEDELFTKAGLDAVVIGFRSGDLFGRRFKEDAVHES